MSALHPWHFTSVIQDSTPNSNMLLWWWGSLLKWGEKSTDSTNTCKKSVPDGVNEDSDYLFSSWADWGKAERERQKWEMKSKSQERNRRGRKETNLYKERENNERHKYIQKMIYDNQSMTPSDVLQQLFFLSLTPKAWSLSLHLFHDFLSL